MIFVTKYHSHIAIVVRPPWLKSFANQKTETHKCGHTDEQHILYYYAHANADILNRKKREREDLRCR